MKSGPSLKLVPVGSKARSLGQILIKPYIHSRGHSFDPVFVKNFFNRIQGRFEIGSCHLNNHSQTCLKGSSKGKDKKWLLKTGDPLIQVHLHCILIQWTQKRWLLKTGDPLIEVTT